MKTKIKITPILRFRPFKYTFKKHWWFKVRKGDAWKLYYERYVWMLDLGCITIGYNVRDVIRIPLTK